MAIALRLYGNGRFRCGFPVWLTCIWTWFSENLDQNSPVPFSKEAFLEPEQTDCNGLHNVKMDLNRHAASESLEFACKVSDSY
jgi:hypothetical protein